MSHWLSLVLQHSRAKLRPSGDSSILGCDQIRDILSLEPNSDVYSLLYSRFEPEGFPAVLSDPIQDS